MSVLLTICNRFVRVDNADLKTIREIDRICSYKVAGYYFSPAYKSRRWDGCEHLFKFTKGRGYHAPAGMAREIVELLKKQNEPYEIVFETSFKGEKRNIDWNPNITLRPYQKEAVKAILKPPLPGRGILKLPIRSGKSRIAAKIICKVGRPSIFIVPSKWLLHQTTSVLEECMPEMTIGRIGDGIYEPQFITVATIQTLARMAPVRGTNKRQGRQAHPEYQNIISRFDLVVADESHHFKGSGDWYRVFLDFDTRFKIGISATVFFDNEHEQESGIIWLRGVCGPIRYEISASRLIREGYLLPQYVKMYRVCDPKLSGSRYSATLKKRCIIENPHRNRMIARLAEQHIPKKTIIIAREHAHIAAICRELDNLGISCKVLTGKDSQARRDDVVSKFLDGEFHVIVGNVLSEGVDIPAVECVINAEGGKDEKNVWQRQRNLTVVDGSKKAPILIDFYDETSKYFEKHSQARLKVYRGEKEFKVEVLDEVG